MNGPSVDNLTIIEAVWIIAQAIGLGFGLWALKDSKRDRTAAAEWTNGRQQARMVVATGQVRRARARAAFFGLWLGLGLIFGFWKFEDQAVVGGLLFLGVLLSTDALQISIGVLDRAERFKLLGIVSAFKARYDSDSNAD